jgi:hypothetical protein
MASNTKQFLSTSSENALINLLFKSCTSTTFKKAMLLSTNPATKHFVGGSFADKVVRGEILTPNCLMKLVFEKKKREGQSGYNLQLKTQLQQ